MIKSTVILKIKPYIIFYLCICLWCLNLRHSSSLCTQGPSANEEQIVEKAAAAALEEDDEDEVVKKPKVVKERLFWGQKTYYPKLADTRAELKQWYIIDATNLRLGRMATEIANILRGKRKVTYHPAMDMGDLAVGGVHRPRWSLSPFI
jgi:hypothetical protein